MHFLYPQSRAAYHGLVIVVAEHILVLVFAH